MSDLLLIDLSAIVHSTFHVEASNPNPDATSIKTVERVRALASGVPFVGIACDSPAPSFRKDIDPNYKANRKVEDRQPLYHQMRLAIETLKADGFAIYEAPGFEADDIIATACKQTFLKPRDAVDRIVIATSDKDLAPLVRSADEPVSDIVLKSLKDGSIIDVQGVQQKFGVPPSQVTDWLTMCGDASDNVPGIPGIGPKYAAAFLQEFGSMEKIYEAIDSGKAVTSGKMTPLQVTKFQNFRAQWPITRSLIQLRFDVPINVEAMFQPRVAQNDVAVFDDAPEPTDAVLADISRAPLFDDFTASSGATAVAPKPEESVQSFTYEDALAEMHEAMPGLSTPKAEKPAHADAVAGVNVGSGTTADRETAASRTAGSYAAPLVSGPTSVGRNDAAPSSQGNGAIQSEVMPSASATRHGVQVGAGTGSPSLVPARSAELVDYERQLEPRSLAEAYKLAQSMFQARLFSAYGNADAVLSTILAGREFGMPAMASLRAMHIVEGKPTLAADTIRALVLRSGAAEYFRCSERTAEKATFVTKRHGEPEMSLTYTLQEGRQAFGKTDDAWSKSGWGKNPADMLVARAGAKLARLVYPDVVHGLYAKEEMEQ